MAPRKAAAAKAASKKPLVFNLKIPQEPGNEQLMMRSDLPESAITFSGIAISTGEARGFSGDILIRLLHELYAGLRPLFNLKNPPFPDMKAFAMQLAELQKVAQNAFDEYFVLLRLFRLLRSKAEGRNQTSKNDQESKAARESNAILKDDVEFLSGKVEEQKTQLAALRNRITELDKRETMTGDQKNKLMDEKDSKISVLESKIKELSKWETSSKSKIRELSEEVAKWKTYSGYLKKRTEDESGGFKLSESESKLKIWELSEEVAKWKTYSERLNNKGGIPESGSLARALNELMENQVMPWVGDYNDSWFIEQWQNLYQKQVLPISMRGSFDITEWR
jgi:predicted  nucleic acid-binding Zn-ribbon protein